MPELKTIIRFLTKINHTGNCWIWTRSTTKEGYGRFAISHHNEILAHRFSYELFKGNIPKGLTLDHLCRNPSCVNPDHLEVVTLKENLARGFSFSAINFQKTHCPKGHELKEPNLEQFPLKKYGHRICKTCHNESHRNSRRKKQ